MFRNQNINKTLSMLQQYGLVIQDPFDGPGKSISNLIADIMNHRKATMFKFKVNGKETALPPSRLLLRRLCVALNITIVILSTRAQTITFQTEQPIGYVCLLHMADSFRGSSTYSPLTLSRTPPTRPRQTHLMPSRTEAIETVRLAEYRDSPRPRKETFSLGGLDCNKAKEFFEDEWYVIFTRKIIGFCMVHGSLY